MDITIFRSDNKGKNIYLQKPIKRIDVYIISGDETIDVLYSDLSSEGFDSRNARRPLSLFEGWYYVEPEDIPYWLKLGRWCCKNRSKYRYEQMSVYNKEKESKNKKDLTCHKKHDRFKKNKKKSTKKEERKKRNG